MLRDALIERLSLLPECNFASARDVAERDRDPGDAFDLGASTSSTRATATHRW
jgi:hypothetical protein